MHTYIFLLKAITLRVKSSKMPPTVICLRASTVTGEMQTISYTGEHCDWRDADYKLYGRAL